ncbi:MAG: TrbI/VirB10 family protein [Rickettsiales bacterium]
MAENQPPENPFESRGLPELEGQINGNGNEDTLDEGAPEVAAKAGKAMLVLGLGGAVVLFLLYSILFSGGKKEVIPEKQDIKIAKKPVEEPALPTLEPPPTMPALNIIAPDIPPPTPIKLPEVKDINPLTPKQDAATKAQALARMRAPMVTSPGGSAGGALSGILGDGSKPVPAPKVVATRIENLNRTIAQGRIIQATMESALQTDMQAPIRAIVSRDTYGEAGTVPLIPKGSRLIGTYSSTVGAGSTRVAVVWTRVIRPDGVDVMLDSPLIDQIGRAGVGGQVDNKFQEIFARSLLSSVVNIAIAIGSDKISGGSTTTTNSGTGGSSTTGDAATTSTTNALNRLGEVSSKFVDKFMDLPPTILIDQGTNVNVFVNKDIIFPPDAGGTNIVN